MFAIQYGLTFCLYMRSLYETPLYSPSSISIRQLSKYWNELLRHWRSGYILNGMIVMLLLVVWIFLCALCIWRYVVSYWAN